MTKINVGRLSLLFAALLVAAVFFYYFGPSITGLVTRESDYDDRMDLVVASGGNYTWQIKNIGELKSLKIDGRVTNYGKARVYIENSGARYLIFDSSMLNDTALIKNGSVSLITAFAAKEIKNNKKPKWAGNSTFTVNGTLTINISNVSIIINNEIASINNSDSPYASKSITMNLSYNSGTVYDANDNGEESVNGIVDLTVEGSKFGWDANETKLCTRWEVYNIEESTLTRFCNGNADCCAFFGLAPKNTNWSSIYYSAFNKDGSGHSNIFSAQMVYYDVNLNSDNLKSEIYNSSWGSISVKFFNDEIQFFNICFDTCALSGFNKSSYNLVFEIEDDAVLRIDKIKYSAIADISNRAPFLLKNISSINLANGSNATINLSEYFSDTDGGTLYYGYNKPDNITIVFENNTAVIVPDKDFEGARWAYITANDSEDFAASNIFMVNVSGFEGLPSSNKTSNGAFEIRDKEDNKLAVIDSLGSMKIKGELTQNTTPSADSNDFALQGLFDEINFVVTNPQGSLEIKGALSEANKNLTPTPNSFIVQDNVGETLAYVNSTGSLFLKGVLEQNISFG